MFRKIDNIIENFTRDLRSINRKSIKFLELKNTIPEIKNPKDVFILDRRED